MSLGRLMQPVISDTGREKSCGTFDPHRSARARIRGAEGRSGRSSPRTIVLGNHTGPGDIPPEIAHLSWDELLKESVPFPRELLERTRRLTEGVRIDLDEAFPDDFVPPWEDEALPDGIAPPHEEG